MKVYTLIDSTEGYDEPVNTYFNKREAQAKMRAMKKRSGSNRYRITSQVIPDRGLIPRKKANPIARIGTKLTKVRIKVGKRTVNGMAKRIGGKVKVFVTPGVAKGLPKRYRRNPTT